jgi:hypothetical protein
MADGLFGRHSDDEVLRDLKDVAVEILTTLRRVQIAQERLLAIVERLGPHRLVARLGTPVPQ